MGLSCCDTMFKIILFVFNFIFFLTGIAVIAVGSVVIADESDYNTLVGTDIYGLAILLIVIGCIITIVCFFGCFGAMKENKCMLYTYSTCLLVIFCAQLAGGIVAFVYRDDISANTADSMIASMYEYDCNPDDEVKGDMDVTNQWDKLQSGGMSNDFATYDGCCGAHSPRDWNASTSQALCSSSGIYHGVSLPASCCIGKGTVCNEDDNNHYTQGCVDTMKSTLSSQSVLIAGIAIGLLVVELVGIAIACCLAKDVK